MCCLGPKYKCLKGGGGKTQELRRSKILGPRPYCVYSNRYSGFDGAEDIADYGLQIASSDGFYWNSGPSGSTPYSIYSIANLGILQSKFK